MPEIDTNTNKCRVYPISRFSFCFASLPSWNHILRLYEVIKPPDCHLTYLGSLKSTVCA